MANLQEQPSQRLRVAQTPHLHALELGPHIGDLSLRAYHRPITKADDSIDYAPQFRSLDISLVRLNTWPVSSVRNQLPLLGQEKNSDTVEFAY